MPNKETKIEEWVRYTEVYSSTVKETLENIYTKEFRKGWFVTEILKSENGYVLKWEKTLAPK